MDWDAPIWRLTIALLLIVAIESATASLFRSRRGQSRRVGAAAKRLGGPLGIVLLPLACALLAASASRPSDAYTEATALAFAYVLVAVASTVRWKENPGDRKDAWILTGLALLGSTAGARLRLAVPAHVA